MKNKKNQKNKLKAAIYLLASCMVVFMSLYFFKSAQAAPNTTVYFDPSSLTVNNNQTFSLDVKVNPGTNQVYGVDVFLAFPSRHLNVRSITANSSSFPIVVQPGTYNNITSEGGGTASISLATGISNPPAITSTTTIATFTFEVVSDEPSIDVGVTLDPNKTIAVAKNEPGNVITNLQAGINDESRISIRPANITYNNADFADLVLHWLQTGTGLDADVNDDNIVNTRDAGIMMSNWGG